MYEQNVSVAATKYGQQDKFTTDVQSHVISNPPNCNVCEYITFGISLWFILGHMFMDCTPRWALVVTCHIIRSPINVPMNLNLNNLYI